MGHKQSTQIASSHLGVGFETLDRDMWNVEHAWPVINDLGVKWARVQTGWGRTEQEKGVYSFAWLDETVDKLLERGVQPWLSVSYGNKLYSPDASADAAGSPPVYTDVEKAGWEAYVAALAKHYRGRVSHFEVWNEPDCTGFFLPKPDPVLYADLVKRTSISIRKEQPDACIIGGAMGRAMNPSGLEYLETCFKNGMAEYIDVITYHGYKYMPEQYIEQEFPAFIHLLKKYKPELKYWQGETGCPSKVPDGNTEALAEMTVSEDIQARWMTRRILLELGLGADMVSYFTMGDFSHYVRNKDLGFTSHYGLLRLEDGSPKPSYYTLQNLAALLYDPLKPADGLTSFRMQTGDNDNPITREQSACSYQVNLIRGNVPVHAWWMRERVEDDPTWKSITMYYWIDESLSLENPVLIDPVSGEVYELPNKVNHQMREFLNLPISNSPLIMTDRSIISIK